MSVTNFENTSLAEIGNGRCAGIRAEKMLKLTHKVPSEMMRPSNVTWRSLRLQNEGISPAVGGKEMKLRRRLFSRRSKVQVVENSK